MQIPLKLLSQKPKQYYFVLHTLKAQMVQAGDEKNEDSSPQYAGISQVLKNLFPPHTWHPKKQYI